MEKTCSKDSRQVAINTGLKHSRTIESVICHVQGCMFVVYSLYKSKIYYFLNVRVPVLDTFLYKVLMFFYRAVPKQSKNVGKRTETAVVYHSPIIFPIYNPQSSPVYKTD